MKHFYSQNLTARVLLSLLFVCAPMWLWAQAFTQDGVNYFLEDENAYVDECTEATGAVSILNTITVDGVEYPADLDWEAYSPEEFYGWLSAG